MFCLRCSISILNNASSGQNICALTIDALNETKYSRMDQVKFFKCCLLPGLFFNTLSQIYSFSKFLTQMNPSINQHDYVWIFG